MSRTILGCLMALWLLCLPLSAAAEDASTLRQTTREEDVEAFLLYPSEEEMTGVRPGYIRYIAQDMEEDPLFHAAYWLGGEPGGKLDLTLTANQYGVPYADHAGSMCTRAAYSMALSYLGVDVTPGEMSRLLQLRDLHAPYDAVTRRLEQVERVKPDRRVFDTMFENYRTDPNYSPVYVHLRKPSGEPHAVLVVGKDEETGRYIVVSSSLKLLDEEPVRVFFMSFNKNRNQVLNSTFSKTFKGSKVLAVYQWRWVEEEQE